ncbi:conserved hypothetical protein [Gammaproteobacteria bacterium]
MDKTTNTDQFILDAYTGGGGFRDGSYLVRHSREMDGKYQRRQQLSTYPNYLKKVVNIHLGFLFGKSAERIGGGDTWKKVSENADGAGTPMQKLLARHYRMALLLGTVLLIVDKPRGSPLTKAQEKPPYVAIRLPGQVAGYLLDDAGGFTEITFAEIAANGKIRYRHFDAASWWVADGSDGTGNREEGAHNLGRVPVVRLQCDSPLSPKEWRAEPWARGLADISFDLFNALSELRELFRNQTFSILTLPVMDKEQAQALKSLKIGTDNAMPYYPDGGGRPDFIAPPSDPVSLYLKYLDWLLARIYQIADLEFTGGASKEGSGHTQGSGVALSFQFQQANRSLAGMAAEIERAETEIAALVSAWSGETWDGTISYPREFNVVDLQAELKIAMDSLTLGISKTFDATLKKRVARDILGGRVDPKTIDKIDLEIDAGGDPYGDRIAAAAQGTGGAGG